MTIRFALIPALILASACLESGLEPVEEEPSDTVAGEEREAPERQVSIHGFPPTDTIRNLAASVVAAPRPADPRVLRFFEDLGAARFELVLSLADLNAERTNYPFEDASWRQMVRSVHSVRGRVLLRLPDVPARLRADGAGVAGPLAGPEARAEWEAIVEEVVGHFARRSETRIDELAGPRAPDREAVWDPEGSDSESRGASFARHWARTAAAARRADPELRISGPGARVKAGGDAWWDGALRTAGESPRPGFFSVGIPGPALGPGWNDGLDRVRRHLDARGLGDMPVLVSGWGVDRDALLTRLARSRFGASHVVAGYAALATSGLDHTLGRGLDRSAPILAGDGPGLFVEDGRELLPTPTYNALRFVNLAEVGGLLSVEVTDPELRVLAGVDAGDRINVVVTRYRPLERDASGEGFVAPDLGDIETVRIHVDRLPSASPHIELAWIDERRGNVWRGGVEEAEPRPRPLRSQVGPWVTLDLRMPIYSVVVLRLTPR